MYKVITSLAILALIYSASTCAELELENAQVDKNTRLLVGGPIERWTGLIATICCNSNNLRNDPIVYTSSIIFRLRLPLGAAVRYYHVPENSYAKFTCDKQSQGCGNQFEIISNISHPLNRGLRVENQCGVDPRIVLEEDNAFIGFTMLKGSGTVDGIPGEFTCEDSSSPGSRTLAPKQVR